MEEKVNVTNIDFREINNTKPVKVLESVLCKCINIRCPNTETPNSINLTSKMKFEQMVLMVLKKKTRIKSRKEEARVPAVAKKTNGIKSWMKLVSLVNVNINNFTEKRLTPLYVELQHKTIDVIRQILENNVEVNTRTAVKCNSLRDTVDNDLISLVDVLIHHKIDENHDENWKRDHNSSNFKSPFDKFTPLHLAISNNTFEPDRILSIIYLLIESGANIELKDKFGRTPLYLAIEQKKLYIAKYLVMTGAHINCMTNSYSTPLFAAIYIADVASIHYLLKHGANVNMKNYWNESTLHAAITCIEDSKVRYGIVQLLLAHGVKINDCDSQKSTALHLALEKEDFPLFYLLISRGSFIYLKNSYGFSPIHIAVAKNLLEEAKILLKLGANVNDVDNQKISILTKAVEQGNEDMIQLLLNYNANVGDKNSVLVAAHNGNVKIMKILIDKGADINIFDKVGLSVLVHAILFKRDAMVQFLLDNGADINLEIKYFMPLTYRYLLYNLNAFILQKPNEKESYRRIMYVMLKHIALKKAQNLYIHDVYMELISTKDVIRNKYEDYCRELAEMKKMKISPDSWVTYFDLLVRRNNALVQCLRYAKVRHELLSTNYKKLFVEYYHQLEKNYNYGLKRWRLITVFEESLNEVLKSLLPSTVTYKICEYFSDDDVKLYFQDKC